MGTHTVHPKCAPCGRFDDCLFIHARAQFDHEMKPGSDSVDPQRRQVGTKGGYEHVATASVKQPSSPQVSIEFSALNKVGEGELLKCRRAEVFSALGPCYGASEVCGKH